MEIKIPEKVEYILNILHENGHEAYAVGGCVRDVLLGRKPGDWDITTSAKPEQVKEIFQRTIDTGIQHGTVTVMLGKEGFEVTTYRIDGVYEDGRHPKEVQFTGDLVEDLRRRDFTINAMAYSKENGIVDAFDGVGDLKRKVIKCVGNAEERFSEDALRMLRAVRFAGQLGFEIEENTRQAIREKAHTLEKISAERIRVELDKLICSKNPKLLTTAQELGITGIVFPEWDDMLATSQNHPHHQYNVGIHSLKVMENVNNLAKEAGCGEKELSILIWAALLHDVGKSSCKTRDENGVDHFYGHPDVSKKIAENVLRRLRFDNYTIDFVCHLILYHDVRFSRKKSTMRKWMNRISVEKMPYLFLLMRADILGQSLYMREEKLDQLDAAISLFEEIRDAKDCVSLKALAVNGSDLLKEGFQKGKCMGEILQGLLQIVLEEPEKNQKDILIDIAKKQYSQYQQLP